MSPSELAKINKQLEQEYGLGYTEGGVHMGADSRPLWRIVWSNDQFEKRLGTFTDYMPGTNLVIRVVTEVREVPKYPWQRNRYILEKLIMAYSPELPESNKPHYEIIYIFENNLKKPVPPVWEMVKYLIDSVNLGAEEAAKRNRYMNPEKLMAMMEEEELQEYKKIYDEIDQEVSPLASALGDREAISMAGLDPKPAMS